MLHVLRAVDQADRRFSFAAFFSLFGIMASHVILETARDALFLARIPATHLPWVYIAIAAASLYIVQVQRKRSVRTGDCKTLAGWLLTSSLVTLGFWLSLSILGTLGLYLLYIWSGVFATLVTVHFWTLLSDRFSITQAKKVYAFIGAGSGLGAIAGTASARLVLEWTEPTSLVLVAAAISLITAFVAVPKLHTDCLGPRTRLPDGAVKGTVFDSLREVAQHPYAMRIGGFVALAVVTLTVADFLFKSVVASQVEAAELGAFFASVYLALNVVSIVVQLVAVQWLIRRINISLVLALLPFLLLLGGVGLLAVGTVGMALAIKGADGSLRHSLHRTASELLYVPMTEELRGKAKLVIELFATRGGQAVASVAILIALALGANTSFLAGSLVALAGLWTTLAIKLYRHYVGNFRQTLKEEKAALKLRFPELDVASLETLVHTLNSDDDSRVVAAMDILHADDKTHLIGSLILHHPSHEVVERALELFIESERDDFVEVADRVLTKAPVSLRPLIIRARTAARPEREFLEARLQDDCELCRMTAMIHLVAHGWGDVATARTYFEKVLDNSSPTVRGALAEAIGHAQEIDCDSILHRLAEDSDEFVRTRTISAISKLGDVSFLPLLGRLLHHRPTRPAVRAAFLEYGDAGLEYLDQALSEEDLAAAVLWELPRVISGFGSQAAADALQRHLVTCTDGMLRHRVVRELQNLLRDNRRVAVDPTLIQPIVDSLVDSAFRFLHWRIELERGSLEDDRYQTEVMGLLNQLLRGKEQHALDSILRLLSVLHPTDDFDSILLGLRSRNAMARASGIELLDSILKSPLKDLVLALLDDGPDEGRYAAYRSSEQHRPHSYQELLRELLSTDSETLRTLVAFHIGELGLAGFKDTLEALREPRTRLFEGAIDRVLRSLSTPQLEEATQ